MSQSSLVGRTIALRTQVDTLKDRLTYLLSRIDWELGLLSWVETKQTELSVRLSRLETLKDEQERALQTHNSDITRLEGILNSA